MKKVNAPPSIRAIAAPVTLVLALAAGAVAFAQLPPPGSCGMLPGQMNCFDPDAEGEMWRSVEPALGSRMQADVDGTGAPEHAVPSLDEFDEIELNSVGDEIWITDADAAPDYDTLTTLISVGECTYAHLGDPMDASRQCRVGTRGNGTPIMGMPPAGKFFYTSGIAVDGTTIYVSDRMNHRVQTIAFRPEDPQPTLQFPIGNGVPGAGEYSYTQQEGGQSGWQLNAPNGLAVDAAQRLLVADGGNQRIAVFQSNGAFLSAHTIPEHVAGVTPIPTSVAISPGASFGDGNPAARIVVLDRYTCSVWVYSTSFALVPLANGASNPMGGACVDGVTSGAPLTQWTVLTGATIDSSNRIYLVDSYNNRIVVLSSSGEILGDFGEPPSGLGPTEQPPVEALETPSSVLIDHKGRVVVNDSDNVRLAFYDVTFPSGAPVAQFKLEVPAPGDDIEEFPTGLAEQCVIVAGPTGPTCSAANGLDPAGRYLKIDTANHRVQRLELADLAIVKESAEYNTDTTGSGRFAVAVPAEKADEVLDVLVTLTPSVAGVTFSNIRSINPAAIYLLPTAIQRDLPDTDIYPGQWVQFEFDFTTPAPKIPVTFTVTAVGNQSTPQATAADPVAIDVRGECDGCDAEDTVHLHPADNPTNPTAATEYPIDYDGPLGADPVIWYNTHVFARLKPIVSTPPVKFIEWKILGTELPRYGHQTHVTEITVDVPYVDVSFFTKDSIIKYWAVTEEPGGGLNVGPVHEAPIRIDRDPPHAEFTGWPACAAVDESQSSWCNFSFSVDYSLEDDGAGVDQHADPQVPFLNEGVNQRVEVLSTDLVGNTGGTWTSDPVRNGRWVNIDMTAPDVTPPAPTQISVNQGGQTTLATWLDDAGATDALSGVNASGVQAFTGTDFTTPVTGSSLFGVGTHTIRFKATDRAGNFSSIESTVTIVEKVSAVAAYTGAAVFSYGDPVALEGTITATPDTNVTGGATISLTRNSDSVVVGTINDPDVDNPIATPGVTDGVVPAAPALVTGNYTVTITYPGTDTVAPASTTATIQIVPRLLTMKADDKSKPLATADPVLTQSLAAGSLAPVYGHTLAQVVTGDVSRPEAGTPAGETFGPHPIGAGTLAIAAAHAANYNLGFNAGTLNITKTTVFVTPIDDHKVYGQSDPDFTFEAGAFTYTVGGVLNGPLGPGVTFSGSLTRRPFNDNEVPYLPEGGQGVGSYGMRMWPEDDERLLSLPEGYELVFNQVGTFSILKRPIVIRADDKSKVYGDAVPALTGVITRPENGTPDDSGLQPGETIPYTLSTTAEQFSDVAGPVNGKYPITITILNSELNANYDIGIDEAELTVTRRPATITGPTVTKIYGSANPTLNPAVDPIVDTEVTGLVDDDTFAFTLTHTAAVNSDVNLAPGYPITVGFNAADYPNYTVVTAPGALTISKKDATVRVGDASQTYGGSNLTSIGVTPEGFLDGDSLTISGERTGTEANVGTYPNGTTASVTGADAGNYNIDIVEGTFVINPKAVTVTADDKSKIYGDSEPGLTATVDGAVVGGDPVNFTLAAPAGLGFGTYTGQIVVTPTLGANPNYVVTPYNGTLTVTPRPVTVQATSFTIKIIDPIPTLTFTPVSGTVIDGDTYSGALVAVGLGVPAIGTYPIQQGTLTLGPNYSLTVLDGTLRINSLNSPPIAVNDAVTISGPTNINVLSNDSDPDGNTISLVSVTQPATGGTVTTSGNLAVFSPTPFFSGTVTFTYTITDGFETATATVTVTIQQPACSISGFTTYTQGGWGGTPTGNNPAMLLKNKFSTVYPNGAVLIGGANTLTFTSSAAIRAFLPAGGTAAALTSSATNPTTSAAGVFAGQVLALQLSVDFSNAGITKRGLGELVFMGHTVNELLAAANLALGGDIAVLAQYGLSIAELNAIVDGFNNNFDNGTSNDGLLACPGGNTNTNHPPNAVNDSASVYKGKTIYINVMGNDSDADGDAVTVQSITVLTPAKGTVSLQSNGTVKYAAPSKWTGTTTFTYTLKDSNGATDTATVTIAVSSNHTSTDGCSNHS